MSVVKQGSSELQVVSVPDVPSGLSYLDGASPAAVLMVDLAGREVVHVNAVARQMAPGVELPATVDQWSVAASLRDAAGVELSETDHPLLRIARSEPVAGQAVSAARATEMGDGRQPLWVVALPMGDAPRLEGHALVVFLPLAQRESAQQAASAAVEQVELRDAAILATGLSFTVADAREPDMPLVYVNPAFTATTGYPIEDALGRNCRFLQGQGTDPEQVTKLREGLVAGREVAVTLLNERKDGTSFWNHVVVSPIHGPEGELTHFVGIQTDVTAAVEAEAGRAAALAEAEAARAALEEANARLRLLTHATAHLTDGLVDTGSDTSSDASRDTCAAGRGGRGGVAGDVPDDVDAEARAAVAGLAADLVPALGDWCVVTLAEDVPGVLEPGRSRRRSGGRSQDVAWWHVDQQQRALVETFVATRMSDSDSSAPIHTVLRTSRAVLMNAGRPFTGVELASDLVTVSDVDAASPRTDAVGPGETRTSGASVVDLARGYMTPGSALDALERLGPVSEAVVPLRGRGRTVGAISLFQGPGRGPLTREQVADVQELAGRAGLLLHNAALQRQQQDLAVGLQRLMLTDPARHEDVEVAVRYVPAAQVARVGGDWYDAFTGADGGFCVVIGDVMGHDTQAAAAMGQLRTMTRTTAVVTDAGPAQVLGAVDMALARLALSTTASAIVARVDLIREPSVVLPVAARLRWANAGHPPPLLLDPDGRVTVLHGAGPDLFLGVLPTTDRTEHQVSVAAGSIVLLYTDGLVERRGLSLKTGLDRLHDVVTSLNTGDLGLDGLVDAVLQAMLEPSPADDVAVLAVRVGQAVPSSPPGQARTG